MNQTILLCFCIWIILILLSITIFAEKERIFKRWRPFSDLGLTRSPTRPLGCPHPKVWGLGWGATSSYHHRDVSKVWGLGSCCSSLSSSSSSSSSLHQADHLHRWSQPHAESPEAALQGRKAGSSQGLPAWTGWGRPTQEDPGSQ